MLSLLLTLGCSPTQTDLPPESPAPDWIDPEVEVAPEAAEPTELLFSLARVHEITIEVDPAGVDSLWAEPYTWVEGQVHFNSLDLGRVGVRLKGRIGSFQELDGKASFKLDLNRYEGGRELYGLEQLTLNNSVVDCSYAKEYLALVLYRAAGVPASRAGFANVTFNGRSYGLHPLIESQDDGFLERVYDEPDGNLYDGKYLWDWRTREYTLLDLTAELQDSFELEEGQDVGHADMHALVSALDTWGGHEDFYDQVGQVVDWEAFHLQVAVAHWVGHVDGYSINTNNYRIYFDPADGKAEIIPWDLDYAFLEASQWRRSWRNPSGRLTNLCFADALCESRQAQVTAQVIQVAESLNLSQQVDDVADAIQDAVEDDPFRPCTINQHERSLRSLGAWMDGRSDDLEDFWSL